jgi:hypothetical protein
MITKRANYENLQSFLHSHISQQAIYVNFARFSNTAIRSRTCQIRVFAKPTLFTHHIVASVLAISNLILKI